MFGLPDGWIVMIFIDLKDLDDPVVVSYFFCFEFLGFSKPAVWISLTFIYFKKLYKSTN